MCHQVHSWALLSSLTCQIKYLGTLPHETKIFSSFRKWVAIIKAEKTALIASSLVCPLHSLEASSLLRGICNALWSSSGITNSFGGTTESQESERNLEITHLPFFRNPGIFHQYP